MGKSNAVHCSPDCEVIPEEEIDFEDGMPEDEYYGQSIWDGEKLVTEKEWDWQEQEKEM